MIFKLLKLIVNSYSSWSKFTSVVTFRWTEKWSFKYKKNCQLFIFKATEFIKTLTSSTAEVLSGKLTFRQCQYNQSLNFYFSTF